MPPKTVTCAVCNQEVLKAHTLARKDGSRACREHPGVEAEAQDLQLADHKRRAQEVSKPKPRLHWQETPEQRCNREARFEAEMGPWRDYVHHHCWVCEKPGIGLQEFYFKQLIAMKRLELRGEPFDFFAIPQQVAALMDGEIPLFRIPYSEQTDRHMLHLVKDKHLRDILWVIRQLQLCGECLNKYGFKERFKKTMPEPTWEQLMDFMPVMEIAIEPVLREIAEKKEREN